MTTHLQDGPAHPGDGAWVRLLDDEVDAGERRRLLAHRAACERCAVRARSLRRRSDAFGRFVRELEPPRTGGRRSPRPVGTRALPRAAAAVALIVAVAAVAASVEPVRAWLADRWEALVAATVADRGGAPAADASALALSFAPEGETFVIDFDSAQDAGAVVVRMVDSPRAHIEVRGDRQAELLILPSELRIDNRPSPRASYEITLPRSVRRIDVRIAGERVEASDVAAAVDTVLAFDFGGL